MDVPLPIADVLSDTALDTDSEPALTVLDTDSVPAQAVLDSDSEPAQADEVLDSDAADYGGWIARAMEEIAQADGIPELPVVRADEVSDDELPRGPVRGHDGLSLLDIAELANQQRRAEEMAIRSSGHVVRINERQRRSHLISVPWELRTNGAVWAWLPRIGQDRLRTLTIEPTEHFPLWGQKIFRLLFWRVSMLYIYIHSIYACADINI